MPSVDENGVRFEPAENEYGIREGFRTTNVAVARGVADNLAIAQRPRHSIDQE
jgi:hypothetical protein